VKFHEDCKGCRLRGNDGDYIYCVYVNSLITEHCPCLRCLIKSMCDKRECELRSNIYYELEVDRRDETENDSM
jgi:hypothetical protein